MKELLKEFVEWLQTQDYGEEGEYDDEEGNGDEEEEKKEDEIIESEAQIQQRLLIEAQKKAQAEQL